MACFHQLSAWQLHDGTITFNHHAPGQIRRLELPCGQCQGCRLERSRQWAVRCMHENQMHQHSCYLTLTFDDEHLPERSTLRHDIFQRFMKRLRQATSRGKSGLLHSLTLSKSDGKTKVASGQLKYYMAGEYGSGDNTERPHYHAIIFGLDFNDKVLFSTARGNRLYTSKTLDQIWGQGHATVGAVTFQSAGYVARYIMKKINGNQAQAHYERTDLTTGEIYNKKPEYNRMSKGIGKEWINKYQADVYPEGKTVVNETLVNAPRYYDKQYAKTNEQTFQDQTQHQRELTARARAEHQTPERLRARGKVLAAKLTTLRRTL